MLPIVEQIVFGLKQIHGRLVHDHTRDACPLTVRTIVPRFPRSGYSIKSEDVSVPL